jgi:hypothetical protein
VRPEELGKLEKFHLIWTQTREIFCFLTLPTVLFNLKCLVFYLKQRFEDWILSPSSGKTVITAEVKRTKTPTNVY